MDHSFAAVVFVTFFAIITAMITLPVLIVSRLVRMIKNSVTKLFRRTSKA